MKKDCLQSDYLNCILYLLNKYNFKLNDKNSLLLNYLKENCIDFYDFLNKFHIKYHIIVNTPQKDNILILNKKIYLIKDVIDDLIETISINNNEKIILKKTEIKGADIIVIDEISNKTIISLKSNIVYKYVVKELYDNLFFVVCFIISSIVLGLLIYYCSYNVLILFDQYIYYNSTILITKNVLKILIAILLISGIFYIFNTISKKYKYITQKKNSFNLFNNLNLVTPILALGYCIVPSIVYFIVLSRINDLIYKFAFYNYLSLISFLLILILINKNNKMLNYIKQLFCSILSVHTITLFIIIMLNLLAKNTISYGLFTMITILYIMIFIPLLYLICKYKLILKYYQDEYRYILENILLKNDFELVLLDYNTIRLKKNKLISILEDNQMGVLIYGEKHSGKTRFLKELSGLTPYKIYHLEIDDTNINEINNFSLLKYSTYINNDINLKNIVNSIYSMKNINISYVDLEYISQYIDIPKLCFDEKNNEYSDTDLLLLLIIFSIYENKKLIIFDNILTRFSHNLVNNILLLLKSLNIKFIIAEQNIIESEYIDNKLSMRELVGE